MPTYDYVCTNCEYKFEEFQRMSDNPLTECPVCKGKLKRLIGTGLSPIFKGTGFYETDYKDSKKSSSQDKSAPTPKKTESKKDSAKEKPAA